MRALHRRHRRRRAAPAARAAPRPARHGRATRSCAACPGGPRQGSDDLADVKARPAWMLRAGPASPIGSPPAQARRLTRWALRLEYDGTAVSSAGSARSPVPSVQAVLEDGGGPARRPARFTAVAAGRTDAGVHAVRPGGPCRPGPCDHRRPSGCAPALNYHLKPHPGLRAARRTASPAGCSARFAATGRALPATASSTDPPAPALLAHGASGTCRVRSTTAAMQAGADHAAGPARLHLLPRQRLPGQLAAGARWTRCDVTRERPDGIEVAAEARSFLHHQVRNMVGSLRLVGEGRWRARATSPACSSRRRPHGGGADRPAGRALPRRCSLSQ